MSYVASGITGASPIWAEIIKNLTTKENSLNLEMEIPSDVIKLSVCSFTGTLSCGKCNTGSDYFIKGQEPKNKCSSDIVEEIIKENEKKSRRKRD